MMEQIENTVEVISPVGESAPETAPIDSSELMELCGADHALFCETFFSDVYTQAIPPFKHEIYRTLDDPRAGRIGLKMFRGSGKTTDLRVYALKRIAYGLSRTIVFTSVSQDSAINSVDYIRSQIEHNEKFTQFFQLEKGNKWKDEHIRIQHKMLGHTVNLKAVGMTGQLRGINIEGKRPDLIIADDPQDEEWSATPEQRKKFEDLFLGALLKSLTPRTENPTAKMVFLQTPLNKEDAISQCVDDPSWITFSYGVLDEDNHSIWPERFPTGEMLEDRQNYARKQKLSIWLREMACKCTSDETSYFSTNWLDYYDTPPRGMTTFIGIDPVPSPSEAQIQKGLRKKDFFCVFVLGVYGGKYYVLDIQAERDASPAWVSSTIFSMVRKWRPLQVRVEGNNYQRELKNTLEAEMRKRKEYFAVEAVPSKEKKTTRIRNTFTSEAMYGQLVLPRNGGPEIRDFIAQFRDFPDVPHDDLLDGGALAVDAASNFVQDDGLVNDHSEKDEALGNWRKAP